MMPDGSRQKTEKPLVIYAKNSIIIIENDLGGNKIYVW